MSLRPHQTNLVRLRFFNFPFLSNLQSYWLLPDFDLFIERAATVGVVPFQALDHVFALVKH